MLIFYFDIVEFLDEIVKNSIRPPPLNYPENKKRGLPPRGSPFL